MNKMQIVIRLGLVCSIALIAALVALGITTVLYRTWPDKTEVAKTEVALEKLVGKQEVRQVSDCSRVTAVRTYEDGRSPSGLSMYLNDVVLANGRRVKRQGDLFIRHRGELICEFSVVSVPN